MAIQADQAGFERRLGVGRRGQHGNWDAEGRGHKGHALAFALHDEPEGRGLHAAGRQTAADFLPKHGGNEVADQAVEDAARLLGLDQTLVDLARVRQGFGDRRASDFVEDEATRGRLGLQNFDQVPGDGLALTIFIRRQQELAGAPEFASQFSHDAFLVSGDYVNGLKAFVHVHSKGRPVLALELLGNFGGAGRQIANVTDGGRHGVAVAQVALDGARLGGRFDDDQRVLVGVLAW